MPRVQRATAAVLIGVAGLVTAPLVAGAVKAHVNSVWSIRSENQLPGTPGWKLNCKTYSNPVQGWANAFSVIIGASVDIHVSTPASTYTVTAVRLGWYAGVGGRVVWQSGALPGIAQPPPNFDAATRLVSTTWPISLTISTSGWSPGAYLLRLNDANGTGSYIPLDVSSASSAGKEVIVTSDITDAAYNGWGGYSLYGGTSADPVAAVAVSLDRPNDQGCGVNLFFTTEFKLIEVAEQAGLNVNYVSDLDLETNPSLVDGASSIVITGHDEYWSSSMRSTLFASRDSGTNLAFLGANLLYHHVRMAPNASGVGARVVLSYYNNFAADPLFGANNVDVTSLWDSGPLPRPSSAIQGVQYESHPVLAGLVVTDPKNFIFAGTGAVPGSEVPFAVGYEYDSVQLRYPLPRPLEIVAHSPVLVAGRFSFADAVYSVAPSGAGVFSAGTIGWIPALNPGSSDLLTTATLNLLAAFAGQRAGVTRPAIDNISQYYPQ